MQAARSASSCIHRAACTQVQVAAIVPVALVFHDGVDGLAWRRDNSRAETDAKPRGNAVKSDYGRFLGFVAAAVVIALSSTVRQAVGEVRRQNRDCADVNELANEESVETLVERTHSVPTSIARDLCHRVSRLCAGYFACLEQLVHDNLLFNWLQSSGNDERGRCGTDACSEVGTVFLAES